MATISHITLPDGTDYNIQATGILYGQVDGTSMSTAFTATIPEISALYDGLTVMLKNGVVTSAENFTININGLGEKGVYSNMGVGYGTTAATRETTIFNIDYSIMLIYSSTIVSGGGWIFYRGYCSDLPSVTASDNNKYLHTNASTGALEWSNVTIPTKTSDLTNDSGYITGMTILSYGSSTWDNFITAYNANKVVYCRASSNANPASGSQTRLAFMAYVNNATTPTNVEFQYYRSVSTHTQSQQGDQVYVYKLDKSSGWSVTTRETSVKVAYNNGITGTYSNGVMTLKHANTAITAQTTQGLYPITIDAYGHITGYGSAVTIPSIPSVTSSDNGKVLTVVDGAWAAANLPIYNGSVT